MIGKNGQISLSPEKSLTFKEIRPQRASYQWIRRILIGYSEEEVDTYIPIVPTGFAYLSYTSLLAQVNLEYEDRSIDLKSNLNVLNQIQGTRPLIRFKGQVLHIGLEVLPSLHYRLFGLSGKTLLNNSLPLAQVAPDMYKVLSEKLENQEDYEVIAQILESTVLAEIEKKALSPGLIEKALSRIHTQKPSPRIAELSQYLDTSSRQLRRCFQRFLGISPKHYSKIIQLNQVFDAIKNQDEAEIYQWALEMGYYDHAHFINDFQRFIGLSPQEFLESGHYFLKTYLGKAKFKD